MKTRFFLLMMMGFVLAGTGAVRAAAPTPPPVAAQELLPLSRLKDAQGIALGQGKPIGFLLTWPVFFPGAKDFHENGSLCVAYFYQAFKDQAVLVNVDHTTGDLGRLPKAAADAFNSPAEGGFAPCLCLTDARCTRLIGMIPLWKNPIEREMLFQQYKAVIADQHRWGEAARRVEVVDAAAAASPAPAVAAAPAAPAQPSAPASSGFAREMELTRQAEQRQKAAPSP